MCDQKTASSSMMDSSSTGSHITNSGLTCSTTTASSTSSTNTISSCCSSSTRKRYAFKCYFPSFASQYNTNKENQKNDSKSKSNSLITMISNVFKMTVAFLFVLTSVSIMITYTNGSNMNTDNHSNNLYYSTASIIGNNNLKQGRISGIIMEKLELGPFSFLLDLELCDLVPKLFHFGKEEQEGNKEEGNNSDNDTKKHAPVMTHTQTCSMKEEENGHGEVQVTQHSCQNNDKNVLYLNDSEYNLLLNVTFQVGNFNPLPPPLSSSLSSKNNEKIIMIKPTRFIPILEARGTPDRDIDKDEYGHRRDTMPIANAIDQYIHNPNNDEENENKINSQIKVNSAVFQFLEEENGTNQHAIQTNAALKKYLQQMAHGLIIRNNPGTLSPFSQKVFDDMLRDLSKGGVRILTHPDVMSTLGAKDSLVKIKHLKCGMKDTKVYYNAESFQQSFLKSISYMPRVVKQNRGSQGEGVWIVKLKDESAYCQHATDTSTTTDNFDNLDDSATNDNHHNDQECVVSLDTELELMEAFDNHIEYHTIRQFIDFCIYGRTLSSPMWTTTSQGRYFEGGLEAGAMVVDQRFLPRIVEGEVRCLMIGSELVEIVHKKPKEGGLSATLQSGAVYTTYSPTDPKFEKLVRNFKEDVPRIMEAFGMSEQPLPLMWTVDYIFGKTDDDLYAGEINSSCPGITQQLHITPIIAKVAFENVFGNPGR